jgi:peptidoglycan/LPS O-acetylase OafA/YrhL
MTASVMKPEGSAVSRKGAADRWISRAAAVTVAGLAGIAGALSYSHMRRLARDHGQAGWYAHAFPLSVDGIEIVASLVLLADRRAGRRSGWLPWTALALGTAGSLAANIATAHPDPVSRIIAGWPALALLLAVKLLSGILENREVPEHGSARASEPALDRPSVVRKWNLRKPLNVPLSP